jgi:hypothetical protein
MPARFGCRLTLALGALLLVLLPGSSAGKPTELSFIDFNNQGPFNNFSGDNGTFASRGGSIKAAFDNRIFHGRDGASLRVDYSVPAGFCGVWHSLLGKASFLRYSLNFTNLYGALRNSQGNPSRVENVRVTGFSFWARGDGQGDFQHQVKVEFKSVSNLVGSALFHIPNSTDWVHYTLPLANLETNDTSRMKEVVFVIEDWRNEHRSGRLYLDDVGFTTDEPAYDPAKLNDDALLDLTSQRAFNYFLIFTDKLGFALDRSTYSDVVSVGAIGFQLAAYCVGHQRNWADRAELERRVVTVLQNLRNISMGPEPGTRRGGYRGFYYHFFKADTGRRKDSSVELSLYDTALLMYGVLTCKEYFHWNAKIQALCQELLDRVQWDWFVDRSPGINRNRFHLAWLPGPEPGHGAFPNSDAPQGGFFMHVDGQTDEAMMTDVLALGSRTHPVSFDTYLARGRAYSTYPAGSGKTIMVSWGGSMFNYFFGSCWLNFRHRGLDLHPQSPRDLWQNNQLAIAANRQFCLDHASQEPGLLNGRFTTYSEKAWGLTACDNLVPPAWGLSSEYFSFGALPSEENMLFGTRPQQAGTIAVYGAVSSINFLPHAALAALRGDFSVPGLWSPFLGLGDGFSLDPHYLTGPYDTNGNPTLHVADFLNGPWINSMLMGIDLGPMVLAIENYRSGLLWRLTDHNPEVAAGLERIFGIGSALDSSVTVEQEGDRQQVRLRWDHEPGASAYNVYSSTNLINWNLRQVRLQSTNWTDTALAEGPQRFYRVKALR